MVINIFLQNIHDYIIRAMITLHQSQRCMPFILVDVTRKPGCVGERLRSTLVEFQEPGYYTGLISQDHLSESLFPELQWSSRS